MIGMTGPYARVLTILPRTFTRTFLADLRTWQLGSGGLWVHMKGVLLFIYLCTWRHLAESKDPWPVVVAEDPLSDYPKERTRQDVPREDVEGYPAYRGITHG